MDIKKLSPKYAEWIFWLFIILLVTANFIFPIDTHNIFIKSFLKTAFGGVSALWMYVDSLKYEKITEQTRSIYMAMCIMLVEVATPIYIFYTRGFKNGFFSIFKFALKGCLVIIFLVFVSYGIDAFNLKIT